MMKRISFRDPDGFVLKSNEKFYRVVFKSFSEEFEIINRHKLLSLFSKHQILEKSEYPSEILDFISDKEKDNLLAVFELDEVPVISYPWEWTPEMLRQAASHTLELLQNFLKFGLVLKDASFFNIQFINGKPVFIDLLSVKKRTSIYPWYAYGQFLRHFVYPLILIKYKKFNDLSFLSSFLDGVPTQLVKSHLPRRSFMNIYELLNVHILGNLGKKTNGNNYSSQINTKTQINRVNQLIVLNMDYLNSLKLRFKNNYESGSNWLNYYNLDVNDKYHRCKTETLNTIFNQLPANISVTDLGANTGEYSEIAINYVTKLISIEQDVNCSERIFQKVNQSHRLEKNWNVIQNDLFMPSANLGWNNSERFSLKSRIKSDLTMCLALIHHLYFKGSIFFDEIINFLNDITASYLIIEFIEPGDEKIKLLSNPDLDRFNQYTKINFEFELSKIFNVEKQYKLSDTRILYYCTK